MTPTSKVLGRSDLVRDGFPAGECLLRTALDRVAPNVDDDGFPATVAVVRADAPGIDCAYTTNASAVPAAGDDGYVVHAHDADSCAAATARTMRHENGYSERRCEDERRSPRRRREA